ncbi:MAG: hypothetical protein JWO30_1117 [Fibrobacteres bacterium]|nr:hypothetical protein [Fibrobacterota bacterium]
MDSRYLSNSRQYSRLDRELRGHIPASRVLRDPLSTLAFGSDAGFYRLIPKRVVKVGSEAEAASVLAACSRLCLPVTFRAAGTSLSGQAISDSVLMQIGRGFNAAEVLEGGLRIRLQPAVIGSAANRLLAIHGRKLGPDPASIDSAMIGGIAANNASGMCCGVARNCYRTLVSLRVVLVDGSILDTSDSASRAAFAETHSGLLDGLSRLSAEVNADADLKALILRKYTMKNTTGYSLNALVDFTDPFDILQHLLIGSEGTLGFISEITLRTVPDPRHKAAILAFLPDAEAVGRAVRALAVADADVEAVEYMDAASLRCVAHHPEIAIARAKLQDCSALLIDVRGRDAAALSRSREAVREILSGLDLPSRPIMTSSDGEYQSLWAIRKGIFPAIGSTRPPGTSLLIEDVAVPLARLAEALRDLRGLLAECGYPEAVLYGHALSGNLHFVFWQDFGAPSEVERYALFMERLTDLVVGKYQGSLKAEHGTGRNMAPFVEKEWGKRAYAAMTAIKALFDPQGILNPDVILSADKRIHLKNLKPMPLADSLIDKCTECGFCESVCPSRDATLTPRQRIVTWREISRLRDGKRGGGRMRALLRGFRYQGEKTCATDGLCAVKCPVGIDTGKLIKSIRRESKSGWQGALAGMVSANFGTALGGMRFALGLLQMVRTLCGAARVSKVLRGLSRILPGVFPAGLEYLPRPGRRLSFPSRTPALPEGAGPDAAAPDPARRVLYFPSCINRAFGPERRSDQPLSEIMMDLLARAGFEVIVPAGIENLCCGLAFESKGFADQGEAKLREVRSALELYGPGCFAAICDMSPCSQRLVEKLASGLPGGIQDSVGFLEEHVLPRLDLRKRAGTIAIHPTCSVAKMGLTRSLENLAAACVENVSVPEGPACCGAAGDRIFLHPELPASACSVLKNSVPKDCREGYSSSRTCEIGMTRFSGVTYRSILYLLFEAAAGPSPSVNLREYQPGRKKEAL